MDEFAEEKVSEQMALKTKFTRMLTMQKAKQDCTDEKIKDRYNSKAGEIKISFEEIKAAVELWSKYRPEEPQ